MARSSTSKTDADAQSAKDRSRARPARGHLCGAAGEVAPGDLLLSTQSQAGVTVLYVLTIWVEELRISERVAKKIIDEHGIYPAQVRAAVVQVDGLEFSWDFDRTRGLRAIVQIAIEFAGEVTNALVVLYPTENPMDHLWRLGSAYTILS